VGGWIKKGIQQFVCSAFVSQSPSPGVGATVVVFERRWKGVSLT
jgi:hypothetical protein